MKKILVFSSYGGGGHISATDALKAYLEKDYEIATTFYIDEVIGGASVIKKITFNYSNEEKFYNYCLQKKWTWFINRLYQLSSIWILINRRLMKRSTSRYLEKVNPDLVISVIPMFNDVIKGCCKQRNIPFLLIPTDLDTTSFIKNIKLPEYDKFKIALSFNDPNILRLAQNENVPDSARVITGFPIKPSFFEEKNLERIRHDFGVPDNKPVILVLMGAAGSKATYSYLLTLLQLQSPVHLLLCLGRNEQLRPIIENMRIPDHITISVISYTNRISDLMAISKMCITKAGTVSVSETIYMNIPMILDNTSAPLVWEKFNINFIQKNKFGAAIVHYKELNALVNKMLHDTQYYNSCKQNLINFPKKNFGDTIAPLIKDLMS